MSKRSMGLLKECIPIFSMLQDDNRQKILLMLFDEQELGVTAITDRLALSRPAVSHHFKLLLDNCLVTVRKEGRERYYSISLEHSLSLLQQLTDSIQQDIMLCKHKEENPTK